MIHGEVFRGIVGNNATPLGAPVRLLSLCCRFIHSPNYCSGCTYFLQIMQKLCWISVF